MRGGRPGAAACLALTLAEDDVTVAARAALRRALDATGGRLDPVARRYGVHVDGIRAFAAALEVDLPEAPEGRPPTKTANDPLVLDSGLDMAAELTRWRTATSSSTPREAAQRLAAAEARVRELTRLVDDSSSGRSR